MGNRYVVDLTEVGSGDTGLVGGKNASLGEMHQGARRRRGSGCRKGFATTADAYWVFLDANRSCDERIGERLERLRAGEASCTRRGGRSAR